MDDDIRRCFSDMDRQQDASMMYFNFDGTLEVAVQENNGNFSNVVVRPDSKGIKPVVKNGIAYFPRCGPTSRTRR